MPNGGWSAYRGPEVRCEHLVRRIVADSRTAPGLQIDVVEVYDDGVKVFWSDDQLRDRHPTSARPLSLQDDLATLYRPRGGSFSRGPDIEGEVGVTTFAPPVPAGAQNLVLREGPDSHATFDLTRESS
jgi:hypothetical protein